MNHNVTCYGYTVEIRRGGKFSVEQAKANEIPLKYWNPLQKGESIEAGGKVYTPDMVLGPARKGLYGQPSDGVYGRTCERIGSADL